MVRPDLATLVHVISIFKAKRRFQGFNCNCFVSNKNNNDKVGHNGERFTSKIILFESIQETISAGADGCGFFPKQHRCTVQAPVSDICLFWLGAYIRIICQIKDNRLLSTCRNQKTRQTNNKQTRTNKQKTVKLVKEKADLAGQKQSFDICSTFIPSNRCDPHILFSKYTSLCTVLNKTKERNINIFFSPP